MVVGIIQARTNSSRLHEKVLLSIQKKANFAIYVRTYITVKKTRKNYCGNQY